LKIGPLVIRGSMWPTCSLAASSGIISLLAAT